MPAASSVPSGSIIRAAQRLSRPNRVRNQGTPAPRKTSVGRGRCRPAAAPRRSSSDRSSSRASRRSSARTSGSDHSARRPGAVTTAFGSSTVSRQRSVSVAPGARSTGQLSRGAVVRSPVASAWAASPVTVTVIPSAAQLSCPGWPAFASSGVVAPPDLTTSIGARSQPRSTLTVARTGTVAVETIVQFLADAGGPRLADPVDPDGGVRAGVAEPAGEADEAGGVRAVLTAGQPPRAPARRRAARPGRAPGRRRGRRPGRRSGGSGRPRHPARWWGRGPPPTRSCSRGCRWRSVTGNSRC